MSRHHLTRSSFFVATLAAVALMLLSQGVTQARLVACRSDPLVILSDGTIVDVSAEVDTLLWNVREVHYTLHIPEGLSAVVVVNTPAWLTSQETFTIIADNAPHQYTSTTTVETRTSNVGVIAHMLVNLGYGNASGVNGQALTIQISDN